jgi:hypothetical protein
MECYINCTSKEVIKFIILNELKIKTKLSIKIIFRMK